MKPELIVHIGMGKTGTSSIQSSMDLSRTELSQQKINFLGYDLQHCRSAKLVDPCFKEKQPSTTYLTQLEKIILKELNSHYSKIIISNERLFQRTAYNLFKKA